MIRLSIRVGFTRKLLECPIPLPLPEMNPHEAQHWTFVLCFILGKDFIAVSGSVSCRGKSSIVQPGKETLAEDPCAQAAQLRHSSYWQVPKALWKCRPFPLYFIAGFISEAKLTTDIVLDDFSKAFLQLELLGKAIMISDILLSDLAIF